MKYKELLNKICKVHPDQKKIEYLENLLKTEESEEFKTYITGRIFCYQKEYSKYLKNNQKIENIYGCTNYIFYEYGFSYFLLKEYELAEKYYYKAINADKNWALPYNDLGNIYGNLKNNEKSEEYYLKAIEKDKNWSFPYNNLGILYKNLERYEESEKYYLKAIEKDNKDIRFYFNLCLLYEELAEYQKAINILKKVPTVLQNKQWQEKLNGYNYFLSKKNNKKITENSIFNEKLKADDILNKAKIQGFILSIDLCDSTAFKEKSDKEWFTRLLHFYERTEEYLKEILEKQEVKLLKYIGDEVMFFIHFNNTDNDDIQNNVLLNQIINFLETIRKELNETYYVKKNTEEIVGCESNIDDKIDIKIVITYATDLIELEREGETIDILGIEVDFWARIKELAKENMILVDQNFQKLYKTSDHKNKFLDLKTFKLKGISENNYSKNQNIYFFNYNDLFHNISPNYIKKHSNINDSLIGRVLLEKLVSNKIG